MDMGKGRVQNSFKAVFNKSAGEGRPAFMPFLVAGDPDYKSSLEIIKTVAGHADMLELGFPYSDPLADGPTIQAADERALKAGMTPAKVFELVNDIRVFFKGPITVLVYANLVYQYGIDVFYKKCSSTGINGVLVPDVPVEEAAPFVAAARKHAISPIFMVTQTTTNERLKRILKEAEGYLYLVSVLGVTGSRSSLGKETFGFVKRIKKQTNLPLALGFGISTREQIREAAKAGSDGVIVGSAIIKKIEGNAKSAPRIIGEYLKQIA